MILDLEARNPPREMACDLCVIGSGAAGLAIASEMMGAHIKTVIVESGGLEHERRTQVLYDVDVSGLPHPGSTEGRFRVCGGSTTKWGGQALPLMPLDFERREWVPHSGWPISFDELAPYYARACQFLMVDNLNFDSDLFALLRTHPPLFDTHRVWYHFSKWSPKPRIREHYLKDLSTSDDCTLLLHANVTDIVLDRNLNRVETIKVRSLSGQKTALRARAFVLCVGGIETARLLLTNNTQQSRGIGNENDLVGRFFQDHPSAMIGSLETSRPEAAQQLFNVFHRKGLKYSVRCTAAPQWQREQQTLNISMGTTFIEEGPTLQDAKDIYTAVRRGRISSSLTCKLLRTARHPKASLLPAWHFLAHGKSFAPGARIRIGLTSEQEPNPESRILLSDRTDALGVRRSNVHWKLTELSSYTIRRFAETLCEEFEKADIGKIRLEEWVLDSAQPWTDHVTDQFHHIGTTRMNDSPWLGVVDRNCQIHSVVNLWVGSSAVFPTSGHSNPTLTIIALCMRLADRLRGELA